MTIAIDIELLNAIAEVADFEIDYPPHPFDSVIPTLAPCITLMLPVARSRFRRSVPPE
ncbi:hypothetical protein [Rubidibacter lacunae]|uniref:hypothetical protein n=1 Tax=Rubidibacter lacunae TaxID=582514 RepID=UPI000405F1E4|nr:hypothetical protein [Rubidibacter lacunae]